ncbi:MAG: helix-turn-helix domain-containing protein [Methanomethylophilus sp.]|jgi:hypothetical protein
MFYCRLMIDRSMPYEEHPCRRLIPIPEGADASIQVIKCSSTDTGEGMSMMRVITNGNVPLQEGTTKSELGECSIERISSTHYTAMITNKNCYICSLISKSKCFLMSSVPLEGSQVEWTIVGPDSATVHGLMASLRDYGYRIKFLAGGKFGDEMTLTPKEEKYLNEAYARGYYAVPRKMDLDELSGILGCSKSTLNVALRTAERKIICAYIEGTDKSYRGKS